MNTRLCIIAVVLVGLVATAWAQQQLKAPQQGGPGMLEQPGDGPGPEARPMAEPPHPGPMMDNFFPPELVMRYQKAIKLTPDQQAAITAEMRKTIGRFTELQWQQSAEEEAMEALIKQERPDEKQVLAQLDKLLAVENDLKRSQLATLVRIKNTLTPEQQAQLKELRRQTEPRMQGQGPGQGAGQAGGQRRDRERGPDSGLPDAGTRPGGQRPANAPEPPADDQE